MFTMINLDASGGPVVSFAAGSEHAAELCKQEGLIPAPYLARVGWVAAERWDALGSREWLSELDAAHGRVLAKLPARTQAVWAMPAKARGALVQQRRQKLARKAVEKKVAG